MGYHQGIGSQHLKKGPYLFILLYPVDLSKPAMILMISKAAFQTSRSYFVNVS